MISEQLDLLRPFAGTVFDQWRHTDEGKEQIALFISLALKIKKAGFKQYSGWAIVNMMRWEDDLKHGPEAGTFKINNNWISYLARYAMYARPELKDFFAIRKLGPRKSHAVVVPFKPKKKSA